MATSGDILARAISRASRPLSDWSVDLEPLLELTPRAKVVLIGEATHGTREFYRIRAELTKRLVLEQGFVAVAAEADWPDSYRLNRYVRGLGADESAERALADFERFPSWMWRNTEVVRFAEWLRGVNGARPARERVGFYGLDLYSLHASMAAVLDYLAGADPAAARRARERYACFDHFGTEPESYAYAAKLGLSETCEREVLEQLVELQKQREAMLRSDGFAAEDEFFHAEQNARVVKNAEEYYRSMFGGRVSSWNLRDTHMADTLDALLAHLARSFDRPKVVVWAHNSHVGDARATQLGEEGEIDVGQLARERHPEQTVLVGFTTYTGSVTAASDWGAPAERKRVNPGLPNGYEELFHRVGSPAFLLRMRDVDDPDLLAALEEPRLERAIGVVYKPETERRSHYFHVQLPSQFDVVIHVDRTHALEPLERSARWEQGEMPETFPSGV